MAAEINEESHNKCAWRETAMHIHAGYNTSMDRLHPEKVSQLAPPSETHIVSMEVVPYPDRERIRVNIEMTPFEKQPNLEVILNDLNGDEVASASIVEPMGWLLEFTMHLRGATRGPFQVEARLFYPDGPTASPVTKHFDLVPVK
jgi:hypothetical protein